MVLSCGAAMFGVRLALQHSGHEPVVETFPVRGHTALLARVRPGRPIGPAPDAERLLAAMDWRRTCRGRFTDGRVATGVQVAIQQAAARVPAGSCSSGRDSGTPSRTSLPPVSGRDITTAPCLLRW